jgi:Rod binding domain-containing protein
MSEGIRMSLPVAMNGPTGLGGGRANRHDPEKMAGEFESYLIFTILKEMEKTTEFSGKKKKSTEQTYMSIAYEKVAESLAKKGIGIKEMIMRYAERADAKVLTPKDDNTGNDVIRRNPMAGQDAGEEGDGK